MLRQIEWWLQNKPISKNGVLPVTTLFSWKFCFSLRNSHIDLIWYTNNPNTHIRTFCKRWSFIWRYFFPVSILNTWKKIIFYHIRSIFIAWWLSYYLLLTHITQIKISFTKLGHIFCQIYLMRYNMFNIIFVGERSSGDEVAYWLIFLKWNLFNLKTTR